MKILTYEIRLYSYMHYLLTNWEQVFQLTKYPGYEGL